MPTYLSPGVYVEEVPSGSAPIAGVGTSTAGFIGVIKKGIKEENVGTGDGKVKEFNLANFPVNETIDTFKVKVGNTDKTRDAELKNYSNQTSQLVFVSPPQQGDITVNYEIETEDNQIAKEKGYLLLKKVEGEKVGVGNASNKTFVLSHYPVGTTIGKFKVKVNNADSTQQVTLRNDDDKKQSVITFNNTATAPVQNAVITVDYYLRSVAFFGEVKLCTNFGEFKKFFGDFSKISDQNRLAHAVYGFFRNGGTRCYVVIVCVEDEPDDSGEDKSDDSGEDEPDNSGIEAALRSFEAIDEIAIVAAPGVTDKAILAEIDTHCRQATQDRVAIFDGPETDEQWSQLKPGTDTIPGNSDYAALYFPWIQVYDPATTNNKYVPPSGHIAGIYVRVDTQRGVHKAPANEPILGALGLKYNISKSKQEGLNPKGINCIRNLNGNIRVWGARTLGGDANGEFKYINVRRLFNYLRESIDEGTQWVVFEPNSPELWAQIRRNVTAFLTTVWRSGALFGSTPEQAFYVKCDEETNPPEVRDLGQVVTEIGVAVVKPAEFVIFRISQWAGSGGS